MKEQLTYLIELQQFDARIQEWRQSAKALSDKIAPDKENLARLEAMLQLERDELAKTEQWRKDQEFVLSQEDEAMRKAKVKLQSSSSTKEFAAANRELESKRRSKNDREEEILKVIDAIEASRKSIAEHEADVAKLSAHIDEQAKDILDKVAALDKDIASAMDERTGLADKIEKSLLKRYDAVVKRRGFAVAKVVNGACEGCHMQVRPQIVNILARGTSIETCQWCNRLLYSQATLDGAATDG